ncbi:MAG: uncharacterized protein JWO38_4915 [Gemmataceae bacterium]|nr:uncharacterized protein [Gemmataceae bacterium]
MIRIIPPVVLAAVLAAGVAAVPTAAPACAPAPPSGERVDIAAETALIIWDEANKTEHFIRRATFQSTAYDFGFLVPTPHRPDLGVASDEVFDHLARVTAPKVEYHTRTPSPGCGGAARGEKSAEESPAGATGVVVLEQKRVGDHDTVVVAFQRGKADDPVAGAGELAAWLQRHGYGFGDNLKAWLVPYVRDNWVVTAFRIAGQKPGPDGPGPAPASTKRPGAAAGPGTGGRTGLRATPVRMSFRTARPFYPYREPADQRDDQAKSVPRSLRVYVVADKRVGGTLGDGAVTWPGRTLWADQLSPDERQAVTADAKLPAGLPAGQLWLTEFEDHSTPRPGTDEVYFAPSADQSPVARSPIIHYTDDWTPWYVGLVGCCGLPAILLLVGGVVVWQLARQR